MSWLLWQIVILPLRFIAFPFMLLLGRPRMHFRVRGSVRRGWW